MEGRVAPKPREPVVRGGGCRSDRRPDRAAGAPRPRTGSAGTARPRPRRLRRCRHVCGADRESARRGGDGRLQHAERRAGPGARRRSRRRPHERRRVAQRPALRRDHARRRAPVVAAVQAHPDAGGEARHGGRDGRQLPRPARLLRPDLARITAVAPDGRLLHREFQPARPGRPPGAPGVGPDQADRREGATSSPTWPTLSGTWEKGTRAARSSSRSDQATSAWKRGSSRSGSRSSSSSASSL